MRIDKEKILNLAQKYVLKGQSEKAIKEYIKLIEATPNDKRLHLKLGDLYLKNGESEKAIGEYLKVAEVYVEEDLNSRAIAICKKVLSINPKHTETMHKIAKLYLQEGLRGDARNYYQSILKIKPHDQEALSSLRSMEEQTAPKEIHRKVHPLPEPPPPKYPSPEKTGAVERPKVETSGRSLPPPRERGTPGSTLELERSTPDKEAETHYHLGIAYKEMELYDYAISEFELASSNASLKFDCYIMLGSCFVEKGAYETAIEYYNEASRIEGLSDDKLGRLHFNLGLAYEGNGMTSEALESFHLASRLDHANPEIQEKIKNLQTMKK